MSKTKDDDPAEEPGMAKADRVVERDIAFVRALAEVLRDGDLDEIEVKREYGDDDELSVRLSRSPAPAQLPQAALQPLGLSAAPASPAQQPQAAPVPAERAGDLESAETLSSPMVGTVYLAPEPGAVQFVSVGDAVVEGQTVLIIEAMKTMNQIPAPRSGTVREILVANAEPVEYGAPLMVIA